MRSGSSMVSPLSELGAARILKPCGETPSSSAAASRSPPQRSRAAAISSRPRSAALRIPPWRSTQRVERGARDAQAAGGAGEVPAVGAQARQQLVVGDSRRSAGIRRGRSRRGRRRLRSASPAGGRVVAGGERPLHRRASSACAASRQADGELARDVAQLAHVARPVVAARRATSARRQPGPAARAGVVEQLSRPAPRAPGAGSRRAGGRRRRGARAAAGRRISKPRRRWRSGARKRPCGDRPPRDRRRWRRRCARRPAAARSAPTGWISPLSSARRRSTCTSGGASPTSSRNSVPPSARSK